mmetsp:Transcript_50517/g.117935  ORF Transcript_50517/g.117935 Transcript_50517/m.117935 type:complete len:217 (+) Transcript_50517:1794-2444(+)
MAAFPYGVPPWPPWQQEQHVELQDLTIYKVPTVNQRTLEGRPDMLERQLDLELSQGGVWDPAARHEVAQARCSHASQVRGSNFNRREWIHDPFYGWRPQVQSAVKPVPKVQEQRRKEAAARPMEVSAEGVIEKMFGALFTVGLQPLAMPGQEYAPQGTVQYTTQHLEDDQEVYDAPYGSRPQSIRIDAGSTRSVVSEPPEAGQSRPDSRKTKTACW